MTSLNADLGTYTKPKATRAPMKIDVGKWVALIFMSVMAVLTDAVFMGYFNVTAHPG